MEEPIYIHAGAPARLTAFAAIVVAVGLVGSAAARGGLSGEGELVSPWIIAALTFAGAGWIAWRALTQLVVIDLDGATVRNISSTFRLEWHQIDSVAQRSRLGITDVELRASGLRRRLTLGAATRFTGDEADDIGALLVGHPAVGQLF